MGKYSQAQERIDKRLLFLKRMHGGALPAFDDQHPDPGCAFEARSYRQILDPVFVPKAHEKLNVSPRSCAAQPFAASMPARQSKLHMPPSAHALCAVCAAAPMRLIALRPKRCHLSCYPPFHLLSWPCWHGRFPPFSLQLQMAHQYDPEMPNIRRLFEETREGRSELLLHTCCQPCRQVLARAA
jgi:hypothetical protein